jgi:hypothetical protein
MTTAPFDVKKMCCPGAKLLFLCESKVCKILRVNVTGWYELKFTAAMEEPFG